VLVQLRTDNFFHAFLLEHNLERFNTSVFGHQQPFWYFLPVMLVALAPWTILAIAGFVQAIRQSEFSVFRVQSPEVSTHAASESSDSGNCGPEAGDLGLFLVLWGVVPVVFFSFSDTKLPGYVLPAVPPFAMLAALWLRRKRLACASIPYVVVVPHALLAGATLSVVLLSPYLLLRLRLPEQAVSIAAAAGVVISSAILLGVRRLGVKALRFLTLLPVIAGLVFLLRIASPGLDYQVSARGTVREIRRLEPASVPVAVLGVDRELEYGLGFYLNQPIVHYGRDKAPAGDHLLISRFSPDETAVPLPGRHLTVLGKLPGRQLILYWVEGQ
jgi:4-amino-4-deoxy-L-arabinose transferase-like glycosyltransferase